MRSALVGSILMAALSATGARAQNYGGGFIELLMTGRDPSPHVRPLRPNPLAPPAQAAPGLYGRSYAPAQATVDPYGRTYAPAQAAPDPYAPQVYSAPAAAGMQMAALPGSVQQEPIGAARAVDPRFRRQVVDYDGPHRPGTVVVDTPRKFLYLVQGGGKALRYGIGVGRPGFEWAGVKTVSMKRAWPDWTPPKEMLKRRPDLPRHMEGGAANPLGARALYLGSSLYRIHGTNEPYTIGQSVSSGCIRMMNEDVTDLYDRVSVGTKVVVI
jgi:lipoprotein-anchoring transpeptidase ErfK/SrfK